MPRYSVASIIFGLEKLRVANVVTRAGENVMQNGAMFFVTYMLPSFASLDLAIAISASRSEEKFLFSIMSLDSRSLESQFGCKVPKTYTQ